MKKGKKPIDEVTVELLDVALRACGINIPNDILDTIIDIVELIEDTKGKTTLKDICELQEMQKLHKS